MQFRTFELNKEKYTAFFLLIIQVLTNHARVEFYRVKRSDTRNKKNHI